MFLKIFDKISSGSLPRITATEIVCGDCGGDELLPIRTNLTAEGTCAGCGGRSYQFATLIGVALAQKLKNKTRKTEENGTKNFNENTDGNCIEIGGNLWN